MISKYLYFSILINYWFLCKGLLYSPFPKTLSKSYCTPCSNNDNNDNDEDEDEDKDKDKDDDYYDNKIFFDFEWENKAANNSYIKSIEYFKNITKIDVKR